MSDVEVALLNGKKLLYPDVPMGEHPTEAARRFNTAVILNHILPEVSLRRLLHVLFEDEELDNEELDDCLVAGYLERGMFGAHLAGTGNHWGLLIIHDALKELDGMELYEDASIMAAGLSEFLKRHGAVVNDKIESGEEPSLSA